MHSQPIIDKIIEKMRTFDQSKRTSVLIFQFNLQKADGSILKSFVLDLKEFKFYEGTVDNADGVVTVGDEEFFLWATKKVTYEELLANKKVEITGNLEFLKKLMDRFHK